MDFRKLDIIYFSLFPWDHPYSSISLSMTKVFAKTNRVFYINHPLTIKDFIRRYKEPIVQKRKKALWSGQFQYEQLPNLPDNVIGVQPPLTIPNNWLPANALYEKCYRYNDQLLKKTIYQVVKDHEIKNYLFINCYNPFHIGVLPKPFTPVLNIYQSVDDITQDAYTARHGARKESEYISQADLAIVTSSKLHELKSPLNENTHVINNAVDFELFNQAVHLPLERPAELKGINQPVICYTGNLDPYRIDYALLGNIARYHRDKLLLVVGPFSSEKYKGHGLDQLTNIQFTGGKHISELPAYLRHSDCTIIPFLKNTLTASIYPLKINEYLAAGKPVVSTTFSRDILNFEGTIELADTHDQFLQAIDTAIMNNSSEAISKRVAVAQSNSWEARIERFWALIEQTISHKYGQEKTFHFHPA